MFLLGTDLDAGNTIRESRAVFPRTLQMTSSTEQRTSPSTRVTHVVRYTGLAGRVTSWNDRKWEQGTRGSELLEGYTTDGLTWVLRYWILVKHEQWDNCHRELSWFILVIIFGRDAEVKLNYLRYFEQRWFSNQPLQCSFLERIGERYFNQSIPVNVKN